MAEQELEEEGPDNAAGESNGASGRGMRSGTRYPYFDLEQAEKFARSVQECGGAEVQEEDLLKHLKLSSSTKSWIYGLSTAKEFGLIERKGQKNEARILLTDLAKRLLMPGDNAELMTSRSAAFLTPVIYRKLFERYQGAPIPKVEFLANVLVREHKLLESVATTAAQAFIASAKCSGMASGDVFYNGTKSPPVTPEKSPAAAEVPVTPANGNGQQTVQVPDDFEIYTYPLRRDLTVTLPLPRSLTKKDVQRLNKWLDTLVFEEEEVKTS